MKTVLLAVAGVLVVATAGAAGAQTDHLQFDVENDTSTALVALHISRPSTNSWEEDILGTDVLEPGETAEITIADGLPLCEYDLRADFQDGESLQYASVDLCDLDGETYQITEQ